MSTTWPSPPSPVTNPEIGRPGTNGAAAGQAVRQLVAEAERIDERGDPPRRAGPPAAAGVVVDLRCRLRAMAVGGHREPGGVADVPTEVGDLVALAGVDGDPGLGVVDPQPHRAVGACGRELRAEHLRAEARPTPRRSASGTRCSSGR